MDNKPQTIYIAAVPDQCTNNSAMPLFNTTDNFNSQLYQTAVEKQLYQETVPGNCTRQLCQTTVPGNYTRLLYQATVPDCCIVLYWDIVLDNCIGPLYWATVFGHCTRPLYRATLPEHCNSTLYKKHSTRQSSGHSRCFCSAVLSYDWLSQCFASHWHDNGEQQCLMGCYG